MGNKKDFYNNRSPWSIFRETVKNFSIDRLKYLLIIAELHITVEQLQENEHDLSAHQVFEPDPGINIPLWAYFIGTDDPTLYAIGFQSRKKQQHTAGFPAVTCDKPDTIKEKKDINEKVNQKKNSSFINKNYMDFLAASARFDYGTEIVQE